MVANTAVISNGAEGVKVAVADCASIPAGSVPVHRKKTLPESGVAVTVTGVSTAYHASPDGETEPPELAVIVPLTEVAAHCHSSTRDLAGLGCA